MKNRLKVSLLLAFALAVGCAGVAAARAFESYTHQQSGVTFDLPEGWKAEPDGEQLAVSPADDSIGVVFWVPGDGTFDAAVEALDEELAKTIKNMKADGEVKVDTHNGMRHAGQSGTGEIEGKSVLWSVDMLQAKKTLIVLTFAEPGNVKKHAEDYSKLVKSIRKAE